MTTTNNTTWRRVALAAVSVAVLAAACSSSKVTTQTGGPSKPGDLAVEAASYDLAIGPASRVIVGVLTADHRFVGFGTVQMRFGFLGTNNNLTKTPTYGPVSTASFLVIPGTDVPNPPPSKPAIVDAATGRGVYATNVAFDRAGVWQVEVTADLAGGTKAATAPFTVADHHAIPAVGDAALPTQNLTVDSSDAPKAAVDSRAASGDIPDPELHRATIAAALTAHRPIVAVFATPVFCVSRFCGPVTDMVQQLAHDYANRATFIHVEIWRDFNNHTINKAAADWLYRNDDLNEPWVFVIGADGKIAARFDNVTTRDELEPLLRQLPVIGPG